MDKTILDSIKGLQTIYRQKYQESPRNSNIKKSDQLFDLVDNSKFTCKECGHAYEKGQKFCSECGAKLERNLTEIESILDAVNNNTCLVCGQKQDGVQKFCVNCKMPIVLNSESEIPKIYSYITERIGVYELSEKKMEKEDEKISHFRELQRKMEKLITFSYMINHGWTFNTELNMWFNEEDDEKENDSYNEREKLDSDYDASLLNDNSIENLPDVDWEKANEFKKECLTLTYQDILRNIDRYAGENVVIMARVGRISKFKDLVNITGYNATVRENNISYDPLYEWDIYYRYKNGDNRILNHDYVKFYGTVLREGEENQIILKAEFYEILNVKK